MVRLDKRIDKRLCDAIVESLCSGQSVVGTSKLYTEASLSTIRRIYNCLTATGQPYLDVPFARIGRPPILSNEILQDLIETLGYRSTQYLDEMQYHCLIEHDVGVSERTLSRALANAHITRKVVQRIAAQRNEVKRMQFYLELDIYREDQLIYVDESAANERTLDRKYGWAPRGQPAIDRKTLIKSKRWSILPALTIDGFMDHTLVVQGSVDGEMFANWLSDHILPQCTPFRDGGPRSVLVMDNCRTHHINVSKFTPSESVSL